MPFFKRNVWVGFCFSKSHTRHLLNLLCAWNKPVWRGWIHVNDVGFGLFMVFMHMHNSWDCSGGISGSVFTTDPMGCRIRKEGRLVSKADLPKPGSSVESCRDGDNVRQIFGCHKSSGAPLAWICPREELDNSWIALLLLSKTCQMKMGVKAHNSPGLRRFVPRFGLALLANTGWSIPKIGFLSHHTKVHPFLSWAESRPLHLILGHADFHVLFLL